jgi:hypothetical protein
VVGAEPPVKVMVAPATREAGVSCPLMLKVVPVVATPVALKLIVVVEGEAFEATVMVPVKGPATDGKA